ncbi:UvrB/uvrC motif protein [Clostridium acetireducens DSM 10703]|uniref:UvrB/uvrC motif protein n=1 Tax=Clostridium acetireducens DSM 10703 TaxID=1121290 RepID=A0A1E8F0G9_9CLOT|nr:UvrB/UvrC motif-containing protein [Clostridium acetireducens]OFI06926.1 UvrB/uvrC motif protein [Clostridium acetireducens DSM 10703]
MLCEFCKKNEANVHITKVINGVKKELRLCDKCAKGIQGMDFMPVIDFPSHFTFQNFLSGIMEYLNDPYEEKKSYKLFCKNCGTPYNEFRKKGLLGCSQCYDNFKSVLLPVIKRVQGNVEHTGKIPNKLGKDLIIKRKIVKLKEDLQKAIATEEYEKAAEIRDLIKEIEINEERRK